MTILFILIIIYSGGASSLDDGLTVKTKSGQIIESNLDDSLPAAAGKVLPKTTFSTSKFRLKHVLDDVDFDQPLTLNRKSFLANKRKYVNDYFSTAFICK